MESCAKSSEGRELILPATGGVLQNDVVIPGESLGLSLSLSREGLHTRGMGPTLRHRPAHSRSRARVLKTRICAQRDRLRLIQEGFSKT